MLIGPILITFTYPLFIYLGVLLVIIAWHFKSRKKKIFLPYSHGVIKSTSKRKLVSVAQRAIVSLALLSTIAMLFASLDPQIVKTSTESVDARRIVIVCDISGSMTIGFDENESLLPAVEKTRLGQAGRFIQEVVEKRSGDAFALVCFSTESYVARDFTTDASQIKEFLSPSNLVGAQKNFTSSNVPESTRIKEKAISEGTSAIAGMRHAIEFITSHQDYTGEEILIYLGDLETDSGKINNYFVTETSRLSEKNDLAVYAVVIARDQNVDPKDQQISESIAQKKIKLFDNTNIQAYVADNTQDIEKIAARISRDIPKTPTKEKIISRHSLAPWMLFVSFIFMFITVILNEKFPRIP